MRVCSWLCLWLYNLCADVLRMSWDLALQGADSCQTTLRVKVRLFFEWGRVQVHPPNDEPSSTTSTCSRPSNLFFGGTYSRIRLYHLLPERTKVADISDWMIKPVGPNSSSKCQL